ncbi:MAG: CBS domain-containing protein, partial [Candidatus Komeilibacteria bacterium]|nr:CBS domain-containing protein [Candidatus Komeilibacteria bacterium]
MQVKDIMMTKIITVPETATYEEAAKTLVGNKISGAPVVDSVGGVIGMITKKDLFKVLYPFYRSFYEHPESYTEAEDRESKAAEIRHHKIV